MVSTLVEKELLSELESLPATKQQDVLTYVRSLNGKRLLGTPGASMFPLIDPISHEDLVEMEKAIEEGMRTHRRQWMVITHWILISLLAISIRMQKFTRR